MSYSERLHQALLVLRNNTYILEGLKAESTKRQRLVEASADEERICDAFRDKLENTIRELTFTRNQLQLCNERLQGCFDRESISATEEIGRTTTTAQKTNKEPWTARMRTIFVVFCLLQALYGVSRHSNALNPYMRNSELILFRRLGSPWHTTM